jgi:DNA-binding CsgD family transcriptional regulator
VARLLVEGKSNREIAGRLYVSPHTARYHTEHMLRKPGVRSRAEAVSKILRS